MLFSITGFAKGAAVALTCSALAACNASREDDFETGPSFRDPAALIGVTSRFDADRFEGRWIVREALPGTEDITAINIETRATGPQIQVRRFGCDPAGLCGEVADTLQLKEEGPGRYLIVQPSGLQRRMWVLWVDEGFRTALVGNPEGTFAWILDRADTGGDDRITAARQILDFNGYDASQLKVNQP